MHTSNAFCRVVIRYVAWQEQEAKRKCLTEEKFYPSGTTDEYFEAPYYDIAVRQLSLLRKEREIIFLTFLGITYNRKSGNYTDTAGVRSDITYTVLCKCCMKKWRREPFALWNGCLDNRFIVGAGLTGNEPRFEAGFHRVWGGKTSKKSPAVKAEPFLRGLLFI